MHISDEGLVSGSVNRSELAAAYAEATDPTVRQNLAAAGAAHGMSVQGDRLVDPSEPPLEPAPEEETESEGGYEDMTKEELQDVLRERGLPTSGNKPELIERLVDDDTAPEAEAEPEAEPPQEEE